MTTLFVIMIIIITLSILYLYFRNIQYNKILESFDNTQSSLSTYYSDNSIDLQDYSENNSNEENIYNVDYLNNSSNKNLWTKQLPNKLNSKDNKDKKYLKSRVNSFINNRPNEVIKNAGWNGIWKTNDLALNAQFIQNNDKLIMSFSNISFDNIYSNITKIKNNCLNNLFLGFGQLNKKRDKFILIKIICNNYTNSSLILEKYKFSGKINDDSITLYSNNIPNNIIIKRISKLQFDSDDLNIKNKYINSNSNFVNSLPVIPDSKFEYSQTICPTGTSPCMDIQDGITVTTYDNLNYNACGKKMSGTNNCEGTPNCVLYDTGIGSIPSCSINKKTYDYMNYSAFTNITQTTGNSLNICYDYLKYFPDLCNACLFCYITNLGTVLTLNYQYFGNLSDQNNLTVQNDIMNDYLNNSDLNIGLLSKYRNIISNNDTSNIEENINALSFTNIVENDNINNYCNDIITKSTLKSKDYVNSYQAVPTNTKYSPCIWQINANDKTQYNLLNSCPITISTSQNYDTSVKHIEYDNDGNTGLSLYSGGTNQQFILENMKIIKKNNDMSSSSVAITTNIKGNNGLYLVPTTSSNGFSNNSNLVNMIAEPEENGKWLILGFTQNSMADLLSTIKKISFDNFDT